MTMRSFIIHEAPMPVSSAIKTKENEYNFFDYGILLKSILKTKRRISFFQERFKTMLKEHQYKSSESETFPIVRKKRIGYRVL